MKTLLVLAASVALPGIAAAQYRTPPPPAPAQGPRPTIVDLGEINNAGPDAARLARPTPGPPPDGRPAAPPTASAARPTGDDGASVDAIVAALYASVSHDASSEPDWERMRSIFLRVGVLIPPKNPKSELFTVLDVDGFERRVKEGMAAAKAKGDPASFFESEIGRRADCFGRVCQVFSAYEGRRDPSDEKPFVRGINGIQVVQDGRRWWIASVAWDVERPDNPIPSDILGPPVTPGPGRR